MIRILSWIGGAFIAAALITFCWSIFRTQGVDEFVAAITIAAAGLGLPGIVALVLAGILGTLDTSERTELRPAPAGVHGVPTRGERLTSASLAALDRAFASPAAKLEPERTKGARVFADYVVAVVAVALAYLARRALDPLLGEDVVYATFFLAVAIAGWIGGFGPALFATILSLFTAWFFFVPPRETFGIADARTAAGLGLFVAVQLCLAGITSGLRAQTIYARRLARTAQYDKAAAEAAWSALEESEARFRLMADAAPVLIWMSDQTKQCTFFNRGWLEFTGRKLEDELGDGWAAGVHPDDLERCLNIYTRSFDTREPFAMQYRLKRRDGEYRWILDRGTPRFTPSGTFEGYIGACMDVTEGKRS